jgi:hypothetical protein
VRLTGRQFAHRLEQCGGIAHAQAPGAYGAKLRIEKSLLANVLCR